MGKRSTWMLAVATIGIGVWVGSSFTTVSNASSQLGSADDPVVTKSYVDQQIQKALGGNLNSGASNSSSGSSANNNSNTSSGTKNNSSSSSNNSSSSSNTSNSNTGAATGSSSNSASTSATAKIDIVELRPGKTLIAKAGTQIIVRHGNATVYSDGTNGIVDVTDGTDLGGNQAITNNHLLLFPRDGRGVMVTANQTSNATLMVIGSYDIQ
ncbi:hypothetical protein [Paenibacillus hunanensis]|uniref:Uncharacterized protein n=1 Tax=Paenibacillus hunanensis TaxID=539262 RepID=A0ABU1IUE3_9BACL|nr:hypothetical protein [Paenibacillus hunanensis]MDR6242630.1 hypothetical protein [Paenibacillus hunanensis]GGJ01492.1 hypothetical protein GCM10008022_08060 [Paenibacillus hunanensis]